METREERVRKQTNGIIVFMARVYVNFVGVEKYLKNTVITQTATLFSMRPQQQNKTLGSLAPTKRPTIETQHVL